MCRRTVVCGRMWLWCSRGSRFFLASSFGSCDRVFHKYCGCVTLHQSSCRRVEVGVVQFLCMHLVVVSEREISAFLLCVGVFCITLKRSGAGPNDCVSKLQVDVKCVNHTRAVNSRFTQGVAFSCGARCVDDACGESRTVLRTHLPAVCPHCVMGQIVVQNIRRAILTEAVRFVAMVI